MERNVVKLVNALDPAVVESSICSCQPADGLKGQLLPRVACVELDRREGNSVRFVAALVGVLRRLRPDILHSHAWGTLCEGVVAARLAGVPYVVHGEHGTMSTGWRHTVVQNLVWRRVDRVLAVSQQLASRMADVTGFPLSRIHVLPNGLDVSRFDRGDAATARMLLGLRAESFVIGTVGRLVPVKDQDSLIAAVAIARAALPNLELVIVGDGPLRSQLTARAEALGLAGVVRFAGHRSDVEAAFPAMDLFVLSSLSEGLSNTIMEAMASGVPVVATRVGGNAELIDDGVNGRLVASQSPPELARALVELGQDREKRQEIARAGRARVLERFSLESMISGYTRVYRDVAGLT